MEPARELEEILKRGCEHGSDPRARCGGDCQARDHFRTESTACDGHGRVLRMSAGALDLPSDHPIAVLLDEHEEIQESHEDEEDLEAIFAAFQQQEEAEEQEDSEGPLPLGDAAASSDPDEDDDAGWDEEEGGVGPGNARRGA